MASKFHRWLSGLPTTQYRIVVSTIGFLVVLVVGVVMGRTIQSEILWFILGWGFNDVLQFGAKRFSEHKVVANSKSEEPSVE